MSVKNGPYRTLSSRAAWSCPWYSVRQDEILLPDGTTATYNVVQHPGAVFVAPLTAAGEIVLIRSYRYTVDDWCWELPAGGLKAGHSPSETARQELREEIGAAQADLEYVGQFYASNGISDEVAHIFIAAGVVPGRPAHEAVELIEIHKKPLREALRMARENEISDGPSALALLLCESRLRELAGESSSEALPQTDQWDTD